MLIDKELSEKLRHLAFLGALLVVVQHSFAEATFLQAFVTRSLTRMAVPLFFVMSGFLLYKDYVMTFKWWKNKLLSRVLTLGIPYFVWGLISIALDMGKSKEFTFVWWMKALGIINAAPLYAGHLWYVRMLMLFVAFSIPIALMLKYTRWIVPVTAMMVSIVFLRSAYWGAFFWFCIGAMIALDNGRILSVLVNRNRRKFWLLLGVVVIIALVRTFAFEGFIDLGGLSGQFSRATELLFVLVAIPLVWIAYDRMRIGKRLTVGHSVFSSSFFVYCVHPYVYRLLPVSCFWLLRAFVVMVSCVTLYCLTKRICPYALRVLSGGR